MASLSRRRLLDGVAIVAGGLSGVLAAGAWLEPEYASTGVRLARCVAVASVMTVDYKATLVMSHWRKDWEEEAAQRARMKAAHARNAARLKGALFANRGIYIKLGPLANASTVHCALNPDSWPKCPGQHMGLLDYLLPLE
jgi:hypothetical protein